MAHPLLVVGREIVDHAEERLGELVERLASQEVRQHDVGAVIAAGQVMDRLDAGSAHGAAEVYWNLLVPRDGRGILESDAALATALHREDRAYFYGRLVIERLT